MNRLILWRSNPTMTLCVRDWRQRKAIRSPQKNANLPIIHFEPTANVNFTTIFTTTTRYVGSWCDLLHPALWFLSFHGRQRRRDVHQHQQRILRLRLRGVWWYFRKCKGVDMDMFDVFNRFNFPSGFYQLLAEERPKIENESWNGWSKTILILSIHHA